MSSYGEYTALAQEPTNNWPQFINVAPNITQFSPLNEPQVEETLSLSTPQRELGNIQFHHAASRHELYQGTARPDSICHSPATVSSVMQHNQLPGDVDITDPAPPLTREQFRQVSAEAHSITVTTSEPSLPDEYSEPSSGNSPVNSLHESLIKRDGGAADSPEPERTPASGSSPFKLAIASLDLDDATGMKGLQEALDALDSRGLLEPLGYKKEAPEAAVPTKVETDTAASPNHFSCSTCPKSFPRRCELK